MTEQEWKQNVTELARHSTKLADHLLQQRRELNAVTLALLEIIGGAVGIADSVRCRLLENIQSAQVPR